RFRTHRVARAERLRALGERFVLAHDAVQGSRSRHESQVRRLEEGPGRGGVGRSRAHVRPRGRPHAEGPLLALRESEDSPHGSVGLSVTRYEAAGPDGDLGGLDQVRTGPSVDAPPLRRPAYDAPVRDCRGPAIDGRVDPRGRPPQVLKYQPENPKLTLHTKP